MTKTREKEAKKRIAMIIETYRCINACNVAAYNGYGKIVYTGGFWGKIQLPLNISKEEIEKEATPSTPFFVWIQRVLCSRWGIKK